MTLPLTLCFIMLKTLSTDFHNILVLVFLVDGLNTLQMSYKSELKRLVTFFEKKHPEVVSASENGSE